MLDAQLLCWPYQTCSVCSCAFFACDGQLDHADLFQWTILPNAGRTSMLQADCLQLRHHPCSEHLLDTRLIKMLCLEMRKHMLTC